MSARPSVPKRGTVRSISWSLACHAQERSSTSRMSPRRATGSSAVYESSPREARTPTRSRQPRTLTTQPLGRLAELDHLTADQLHTMVEEPGERFVDVVDREHDAEVAQSVDRCGDLRR